MSAATPALRSAPAARMAARTAPTGAIGLALGFAGAGAFALTSAAAIGPIGVRISAKQAADTMNEMALAANAAAGDPRISSTAPTAGPTTIAKFMIADISAFTEARPRSSTRAGIEA